MIMFMVRTIPLYRIASEIEIWKWRSFRKALDKQDKKNWWNVIYSTIL